MTPDRASSNPAALAVSLLAAAVMAACGGGNNGSAEQSSATAQAQTPNTSVQGSGDTSSAASTGTTTTATVSTTTPASTASSVDSDPDPTGPLVQPSDNFADASNPDPQVRAQSIAGGFVDTAAVFINAALIPVGSGGLGVDKLQPTTELPVPEDDGAFRTVCQYSHMAYDDPIVFPNQPGKSHLHAFFGNHGANAYSTAKSIASTGNSTCKGGTINRTAYWVPAMIDTRNGAPVKPSDSNFYYKSGDKRIKPSSIHPMPQGLRMIAGDPKNTSPSGPFWYNCKNGSNVMEIPNCGVGVELYQNVSFPQCWDGVNLDSPDHKSHMAYPIVNNAAGTVLCPADHPVMLPQVTFRIIYTITEANAPTHWRLSSDTYDRKLPAGYSSHGDWFNGWKSDISDTWAKKCIDASVDCHSHLLGDGRKMSF